MSIPGPICVPDLFKWTPLGHCVVVHLLHSWYVKLLLFGSHVSFGPCLVSVSYFKTVFGPSFIHECSALYPNTYLLDRQAEREESAS